MRVFKFFMTAFFLLIIAMGTLKAQSDVVGKVTVGYQGWFAATGDGSPINAWWHWTQNWSQSPSSSNNGIVSWPDVRDYTATYATSWPNLNNGQQAKLFSSFNDQTVNVQFQWMQQNGIDCAALQRFNPTGGEGPVRDAITAKVKTAAEATGRKFYIMYDVSGWTNMQSEIKNDWTTKMSQYISSSAYARHNGKPVVCIWGFGFNDNNHPWAADVCLDVVNWFKGQGCYVIGGVPREWRTGVGGSRAGYIGVYHALNMISPWLIGAVGSIASADDIYNNFYVPDQADCNANGVAYQPCVLPGDLQQRQRVHGDLMWRMFYNAVRAGCQGIYISMFDEFNEGNQIAKTAENISQVPAGSNFLPLDEDGTAMSSDYYLRLTGDGGKMLKGQIQLTATRPTPFFVTAGAPVVSSGGTASGTVGSAFSYTITASNSPTSYGASALPPGLTVNTSNGVISGTPSSAGTFNATVTATNANGTGSKALAITINPVASQSPYFGTPWAIPGTIEVENFDNGGEGVAYHDNDVVNSGGQGRTADGVDTETCSEGGLNIGWTNTGEWLEYTVNVATTANYSVDVRAASLFAGGTFHIEFNGVDKTGLFTTTNTGAWQTWTTISKTGISLTAGQQIMRVYLDNANFNLNKIIFTAVGGNVIVTGVTVSPTSATIAPGATQQLTATVSPANATNKNVSWTSANTAVATVSSTGLVTGIANGTATITVTTQDQAKTATSVITVSGADPAGVITCYKAPGAITVNGQLAEAGWNVTRSFSKATVGSPNNTATFGVLWDNTNLYIGAKVLDANLFSDSPNAWDDDAVEIYIDANNNKLTTYDGLDNQIIKNYNKSTVFTKLTINGLQHAWSAITGGYSMEMAIPWSQLGISAPAQNTTIGFDIGYDDDDNGGVREDQAVWNGTINNYQNTSAFGSLRLNTTVSSGRLATHKITVEQSPDRGEEEVTVSPNPSTNGLIKISVPGNKGKLPFTIVNVNGKIIHENVITQEEKIIDMTQAGKGLYILNIYMNQRLVMKKLLVE
jgi:hypothetical protein